MFNGLLDDMPVGKISFQYKTEVLNYNNNKINLRAKLEQNLSIIQKSISILDEVEATLNEEGIAEDTFEFNLTPRGTNFYNKEEEQDYNHLVFSYSQLTANLDFLDLKYLTYARSISTNQQGYIVNPGPRRLQPRIVL